MTIIQAPVIDLDDPACSDPRLVGGKAAELARLRAEGHPVPGGVVVPASLLAGWSQGEPCPPNVRAAVESAVDRLGKSPLAVRSSADSEDGSSASYAGTFTTVLGVRGTEAVIAAVRTCLDSAAAARLTAYRGQGGVRMSVLLQPMLAPEAAGVAFTADPLTGETDVVVISAAAGLGDQVADGTADPEEWRVAGTGPPLRSHGKGSALLSADQARDIAALAQRIAERRAGPQDVEWAIVDGRVRCCRVVPLPRCPFHPPRHCRARGGRRTRGTIRNW